MASRRTFLGGAGGGVGDLGRRIEFGFGTDPLDPDEYTVDGVTFVSRAYAILMVTASSPARVRFYVTAAARDADVEREFGDPSEGCVLDVMVDDEVILTPAVVGGSLESPPSQLLPFTVTNLDEVERAISVGLTYVVIEV